jgi:hypothetical protein
MRLFAFDFHILATLLFRGWSVVAGVLTLIILPTQLDSDSLGYYYTFSSLIALQVFFELGVNQVILQFVSHEFAHLRIEHGPVLTGPVHHVDRLTLLSRAIVKWYTTAAFMFALIIGGSGYYFLQSQAHAAAVSWSTQWFLLVILSATNLWISPFLTFIEGSGQVGQVARSRLYQSIIGYTALWVVALSGGDIWAVLCVPLANASVSILWLRKNGKLCRWLVSRLTPSTSTFSWRTEILPFQWRIAVSWISGYFIFNLFTPVTFSKFGPAQAGRVGVALAMFNAISAIGMSWVTAKSAHLNMHVARNERVALNRLFTQLLARSTIATVAICIVALAVVHELPLFWPRLAAKMSEIVVLLPLAISTVANSIVFSQAIYMRAHKEEPMLSVSVVSGILAGLAIYFGSRFGMFAMMCMYTCVTVIITLPWTFTIFLRYYRRSNSDGDTKVSTRDCNGHVA